MTDTVRLSIAEAQDLVLRAFRRAGVPEVAAASVADALVAAEAEGQVGHGFSRVADYVAQVQSGKVKRDAEVRTDPRGPASLLTDADFGFAYPALDAARAAGLPAAAEAGIAVMAVTNSHHCGALSVQVERIAEAGFIGLMVANTPKAMAPWGAREAVFGTNPIAFAVPRADAAPLVIDLSLSVVARGKVMAAKKAGRKIPEGWALDAEGQPTTDPEAALAGTMVPLGGAKGTALALMVEVLAAAFTDAHFSHEAASFLAPDGPAPRTGQTMIALKPGGAGFASRLEALLTHIEGLEGARLPGTRRLAAQARAKAEGLDVPRPLYETVTRLAEAG